MTSLAYLHDCHSRYDERSIVQKKKSRPYLQYSLKERNCSCSRAGNSGIQPVYRALPCLNGLLESKWSMGLMGLIPRLI